MQQKQVARIMLKGLYDKCGMRRSYLCTIYVSLYTYIHTYVFLQ